MYPINPAPRSDSKFVVLAKNQPQYIPLPANLVRNLYVETRWKLSWLERLRVLCTGEIHLYLMTFGNPLQPIRLSVKRVEDL